jgi:3-oxosteroid 1-dehydrogenase
VPFDARELGPWRQRLRAGTPKPRTVHTYEIAPMGLARRNPRAAALAARVATRTIVGRLKRQALLTSGAALIGQLLALLVARSVPVWTETSLEDLVVEDGRVVGVVVSKRGKQMRIGARAGVLLAAGGFARNDGMRREFGRQPSSTAWTSANPGDTGEVLRIAMKHGAATDLMDEAWWIPSSVLPDGSVATCNADRCRPGTMIVDTSARRYFNEAVPYMEAGQLMYEHERSVGGAIPSWLLLDARARERYPFAYHPPGVTPDEWLTSGYMKKADTLTELARMCAIDPIELTRTVERFNGFAATGADRDFGRGESAHERYQGDITHKPNPSLGPIDTPPYYAVALYPGDVGTSGGLLCDENSRVLNQYGEPMPGLYATGNCTASVMGRAYLGPGASIGASLFFAYVAATHALQDAGEHSGATF